jgi:hypothetical protein
MLAGEERFAFFRTLLRLRTMPRSCTIPALLAIYGAAVLAVPIAVTSHDGRDRAPVVASVDAPPAPAPTEAAQHDPLVGLWAEPIGEGEDRVRFYYFHGDGHGLYRYGRRASTFTNSFDYVVVGDRVELVFRKSGAAFRVPFAIERGEDGRDRLVLATDPRGDGRGVYVRTRGAVTHGDVGVGGRMWLDRTRYATGGYGFALYQMRPAGIDGRGTGWFHRGDFDDWSTESLVYRMAGDRLELAFEATGEHHATRFAVEASGDDGGARTLVLAEDPRDWWHAHRYVDVGPSFGTHDGGEEALALVVATQ